MLSLKKNLTCNAIPRLTLQPKLVLTDRGVSPRLANNLVKDVVSWIRGRSSAITQQVLTQARFIPLCLKTIQDHHLSSIFMLKFSFACKDVKMIYFQDMTFEECKKYFVNLVGWGFMT